MGMIVYCDVVSVEIKIYFGLIEMLIVVGFEGDLGIVLGYMLLLIQLKLGLIWIIKQGGEEEIFYVFGGYLEVQFNLVILLVDIVVCVKDVDEVVVFEVQKEVEKVFVNKIGEFEYFCVVVELVEVVVQFCIIKQLCNKM